MSTRIYPDGSVHYVNELEENNVMINHKDKIHFQNVTTRCLFKDTLLFYPDDEARIQIIAYSERFEKIANERHKDYEDAFYVIIKELYEGRFLEVQDTRTYSGNKHGVNVRLSVFDYTLHKIWRLTVEKGHLADEIFKFAEWLNKEYSDLQDLVLQHLLIELKSQTIV